MSYLRTVQISSKHNDGISQDVGCVSTGKDLIAERQKNE